MSKVTKTAIVHHSAIIHFPQAIERIREQEFSEIIIPDTSISGLSKGLVSQTVSGMRITEAIKIINNSQDIKVIENKIITNYPREDDCRKEAKIIEDLIFQEDILNKFEEHSITIFVQDILLYTILNKRLPSIKKILLKALRNNESSIEDNVNNIKIVMLSLSKANNFFSGNVNLEKEYNDEFNSIVYQSSQNVPLVGFPERIKESIFKKLHIKDGGVLPNKFTITLKDVNGDHLFVVDNGEVYDSFDYRNAINSHRLQIKEKNPQQRVAMSYLLRDDINVVSLGGMAGTGKTALALAAGAYLVGKNSQYDNFLIFKPVKAVGGEEIGFLPGTEAEKMSPWSQGIHDAIRGYANGAAAEALIKKIEVLPLTNIRGRTFHKSFVIVDEAQSLDMTVLKTILTRLGENSKLVLTHDITQNDNRYMKEGEGMPVIVEKLKTSPFFAHIDLVTSERSLVAKEVNRLLEEF